MNFDLLPLFAEAFKKTATFLALIDPVAAIPIFLAASSKLDARQTSAYARNLGGTVAAALLASGFFGAALLRLFGISIAGMQTAGGAIGLILAIAIVLGQEQKVKGSDDIAERARESSTLVPLGIPLLAGPATLSFAIATSSTDSIRHALATLVIPGILCGLFTWLAFEAGAKFGARLPGSALSLVERLAGFLLAAMSVEMLAKGIKILFADF